MINPYLSFILLFVEDPLASAAFYSKLFNLNPIEQYPTFALFAFKNGVMLGLWSKKTAEPTVTALAGATEIAFIEENIDATYNQLLALGIPIAQKPTHMSFGYTFVALDPDGHRIRIYKLAEK